MSGTKIRVINEAGKDVKRNGKEVGDIVVKGHGVMEADKTVQTQINGWLFTGDKGTVDENGNIAVVERSIDISAEDHRNISIIEIERAFNILPEIREAAAVLTPHKNKGEIIKVFIVLNSNHQVTDKELITSAKEKIKASEKLPMIKITFLEELPRTTSGKLLRLQLKDIE